MRRCARTAGSGRSSKRPSRTPENVIYAAIVNNGRVAVAHSFRAGRAALGRARRTWPLVDRQRPSRSSARCIPIARSKSGSRSWRATGSSARSGLASPRCSCAGELRGALCGAAQTALVALVHLHDRRDAAVAVDAPADPRHPERSGRFGRGELDVTLDLPEQEFRDLGSSFDAVSAQLSAMAARPRDRDPDRAGPRPTSSRSWRTSRTRWRSSRREAS